MFTKVHHIGIAVRDLEAARKNYETVLGLKSDPEIAKTELVEAAVFHVGDTIVEVIRPIDETSSVGRFIKDHGEGLHHVAYQVDDIAAEMARLKAAGYRLVDEEVRRGLHGWKIAFVHPKSCDGVLTELVEV